MALTLIPKMLSGAVSPTMEGERVCCSPQRSQSSQATVSLPSPPPREPHPEHWPCALLVACRGSCSSLQPPLQDHRLGREGVLLGILSPPHSLELTLSAAPKGPGRGWGQAEGSSLLPNEVWTSCSLIRFSDPKGATLDLCFPLNLMSTGP